MGGHDLRRVENFAKEIKFDLDWLEVNDGLPTQDELDVFLLGGTVPAQPVRFPDLSCSACWGRGTTCVCHGQGACQGTDREPCPCWRQFRNKALDHNNMIDLIYVANLMSLMIGRPFHWHVDAKTKAVYINK